MQIGSNPFLLHPKIWLSVQISSMLKNHLSHSLMISTPSAWRLLTKSLQPAAPLWGGQTSSTFPFNLHTHTHTLQGTHTNAHALLCHLLILCLLLAFLRGPRKMHPLPCTHACAHALTPQQFPPPQKLNCLCPKLHFTYYLFCKRGRNW